MEYTESKIKDICGLFERPHIFEGFEHIKVGNVNQTFRVRLRLEDGEVHYFLLQRVNTYAFRHPRELMRNERMITEHMHRNSPESDVIRFELAKDGQPFVEEADGFWRMYSFIPAITYNTAENPDIVYQTGVAFSTFQMLLNDFPIGELYETIPFFHNTPRRIQDLIADAERDAEGRKANAARELEDILALSEQAFILQRELDEGKLPLRVTHNDTKLNNVLFDKDTHKAITVIDLDTVMPGLIAYDFGDAIRYMANEVAEDSPNWQNARVNMKTFRIFTEGFMSHLKNVLSPEEMDTLSYGPFVLALELASRFLADYLDGDKYFNTDYPEHNLVRARCQLQLAKDCLAKREEMNRIIYDSLRDYESEDEMQSGYITY